MKFNGLLLVDITITLSFLRTVQMKGPKAFFEFADNSTSVSSTEFDANDDDDLAEQMINTQAPLQIGPENDKTMLILDLLRLVHILKPVY